MSKEQQASVDQANALLQALRTNIAFLGSVAEIASALRMLSRTCSALDALSEGFADEDATAPERSECSVNTAGVTPTEFSSMVAKALGTEVRS